MQKAANLSNKECAEYLGVNTRTIGRWRVDKTSAPTGAIMSLEAKIDNQWIKVSDVEPENEESQYWVFDGYKVIKSWLNDYKQYGGAHNLWQDLGRNDFSMRGTSYIELKKPEPPRSSL